MLVREGNKIRVENKVRTDELFKGLIGKVNATKEDSDKLVSELKKVFRAKEFDIDNDKYGFNIRMYTSDNDNSYIIRIGEKTKDKICIQLKKNGKDVEEIKGLRLNNKQIINAIYKLLEKHTDSTHLEATSRVNDRIYRAERDRIEREREAEKERERKLLKQIEAQRERDAQKKKGSSTSYSRKDWVDISDWNNVPSTWIIDPGRL